MIISAMILADRKRDTALECIKQLFLVPEIDRVYLNIQTSFPNPHFTYHEILQWLNSEATKPYDIDVWQVMKTTWRPKIRYDQHQARLPYIVTARNMAIDYALAKDASHLLFVDSDVKIDQNGFKYLLALDKNLSGGLVPGRGSHSHVNYVFPGKIGISEQNSKHGPIIRCGHGTCGYMLIKRKVFGTQRFRWGDDEEASGQLLSEDPAYCEDWYHKTGEPFYIAKLATAKHLGELDSSEAAKDEWGETRTQQDR